MICGREDRNQPMSVSTYLPELVDIPNKLEHGRRVHEGYQRGAGLQFGDLEKKIRADPVYRKAFKAGGGRSILAADNQFNLFLIMRFFLARLPHGHIVEFGAYRGGNAIFMAAVASQILPDVRVYALDTFEGMPETDKSKDAQNQGDFADVDLAELESYVSQLGLSNLVFRKGLFQDTAAAVLEEAGAVSLAHIDCDVYSAVAYSYDVVREFMVPGGYLVFDDATVSTCMGATEVVEDHLVRRDGLSSEQIYPHFVFRAPGGS